MAIDIFVFEKKRLLEKFLEANDLHLVSDIKITDCEFGIPLNMDGDYRRSYQDIFMLFDKAKFTVSGLYGYSTGAVVCKEPHMFVYVMRDSEFFNTEKLIESDSGLCHFDEKGNLKVCPEMKSKIMDDIHSSDHWKRFKTEFEERNLKNIRIGYSTLKYCPFCGGKTSEEVHSIDRDLPDFIEERR